MTSGERRVAERLEQKLDADYLLWYDVAVGPLRQHPDFVVMHPRRGILILEVKDFRLSTIIQANKQTWDIHTETGPKTVPNPLEQARQYAHQVVHALERDPQLVHPEGRHQGKLAFPWSYGVVLPNITRKQFQDAELHHALEPHRVPCKDEMWENVGIQAQGRTTILKINYRNTKQILQTASLVAAECSSPHTPSASKGLEFPVVALPGVGHMPAKGEDEKEAARVFYVAATRATQRLVVGVGGDGGFGSRLGS